MHPLSLLPKVGKTTEKELNSLNIFSQEDLAEYLPRSYEDRREEMRLKDLNAYSTTLLCKIYVDSHSSFPTKNHGKTLKIVCRDDNSTRLELLCFNRPFLKRAMPIGSSWYIRATITKNGSLYQSSSFEIKRNPESLGLGKILPIYPLSGTLTQNLFRTIIPLTLNSIKDIPEPVPLYILDKFSFLPYKEALKIIHNPRNFKDIEIAKKSLAFQELLNLELSILKNQKREVRKSVKISALEMRLMHSLPFHMTEDQMRAISQIDEELDSKGTMNRLLQGDVGAGKTLVAWITALHAISKGEQVAFMAPTELLSRQHAEKASEILSPLGVRLAYITGDLKGKGRALLLNNLKEGKIDLAIGTHSLFSSDVSFKNLKYIIIDEQHRFGVNQRKALKEKGENVNILSMTATPIPRTLALTIFADMNVSTIKVLPKGRIPIKTFLVDEKSRDSMYKSIEVEFKRGHQAYFVYPRIDGEGNSELRDVTSMFSFLKEKYPTYKSALLHSELNEEEKIDILKKFRNKELTYLVSTSVIEVGIDIPDATCIIIEHADRFGLSALHQLRGRVGRSTLPSYCFLVSDMRKLTEDAKERLKILKETNDGFLISERDLALRGPGEIAGEKQSGFLKLKFASLTEDFDLIEIAKEEAERILKEDPGLIMAKNSALRKALE